MAAVQRRHHGPVESKAQIVGIGQHQDPQGMNPDQHEDAGKHAMVGEIEHRLASRLGRRRNHTPPCRASGPPRKGLARGRKSGPGFPLRPTRQQEKEHRINPML